MTHSDERMKPSHIPPPTNQNLPPHYASIVLPGRHFLFAPDHLSDMQFPPKSQKYLICCLHVEQYDKHLRNDYKNNYDGV